MKFRRRLTSSAAKTLVKFHSDWKTQNIDLSLSRPCEFSNTQPNNQLTVDRSDLLMYSPGMYLKKMQLLKNSKTFLNTLRGNFCKWTLFPKPTNCSVKTNCKRSNVIFTMKKIKAKSMSTINSMWHLTTSTCVKTNYPSMPKISFQKVGRAFTDTSREISLHKMGRLKILLSLCNLADISAAPLSNRLPGIRATRPF